MQLQMLNRKQTIFLTFLAILLAIPGSLGKFSTGKSEREDGPHYYRKALKQIEEGNYEDAKQSLLISMGEERPDHGWSIPRLLKKDVGRYQIRGAEYLTNCFPHRELGIIFYYLGIKAKDMADPNLETEYFYAAKNHLKISVSQLPTKRAYDYLTFTERETTLNNTQLGPNIHSLYYGDDSNQKVEIKRETIKTRSNSLTLTGKAESPALVNDVFINGVSVDLQSEQLRKVNFEYEVDDGKKDSNNTRTGNLQLDYYQPYKDCYFEYRLSLNPGENQVEIVAHDVFNNRTRKEFTVFQDAAAPTLSCLPEKEHVRINISDISEITVLSLNFVGGDVKQFSMDDFSRTADGYDLMVAIREIKDYKKLVIETSDELGNRLTRNITVAEILPVAAPEIENLRAEDLNLMTSEDEMVEIDFHVDESVEVEIISKPSLGHLKWMGNKPTVVYGYTPKADLVGNDFFTYRVKDPTRVSRTALVTITITPVNDPPVARSQKLETEEDTRLEIVLDAVDGDSSEITYHIKTNPVHGKLGGEPPTLTYSPHRNFYGADTFTFYVRDQELESDPQEVIIDVKPIVDAPRILEGPSLKVTMSEDDYPTPFSLQLNTEDPDSEQFIWRVTYKPIHGELSILESVDPKVINLSYLPKIDYHGTDTFAISVIDDDKNESTTWVKVIIEPVNDRPVAVNKKIQVIENQSIELTLSGYDVEDEEGLSYTINKEPGHGKLLGVPPFLRYQPTPNFSGSDSFQFTATGCKRFIEHGSYCGHRNLPRHRSTSHFTSIPNNRERRRRNPFAG